MADQAAPVFIGGSPRSGTTLLLRLLGRHPQVEAYYESKLLASLIDWLEGTVFNPFDPISPFGFRAHEYFTRERIYRCAGLAMQQLYGGRATDAGRSIWLEKTPRNSLHVDALLELLPAARFLHVVRDGRDVAVSMPSLEAAPQDIVECARLWAGYTEAGRSACRRHPDHCLEIRYEQLVRAPQQALEPVCRFLGLDLQPDMLDLDSVKVSLFSEHWGESAPTTAPIARWRRHADFPREAFKAVAGDLLLELGYESTSDW
ncbi:MAG: sulfotransferase [Pseudomonadota bacterium]